MTHQFPFPNVQGYLSPEDRVNLKMLAERQSKVHGCFFEIGSHMGLSALCILSHSGPVKLLECFDFFEDVKFETFIENVARTYPDRVLTHRGDFKNWKIENHVRYSLGMVDHSHSLEDTKAAYEMFWPHLSSGGVMCFHDVGHPDWPEATEYIQKLPHITILETSLWAIIKK